MEIAENWVNIIPVEAGIIYTGNRGINGEAELNVAKCHMPWSE